MDKYYLIKQHAKEGRKVLSGWMTRGRKEYRRTGPRFFAEWQNWATCTASGMHRRKRPAACWAETREELFVRFFPFGKENRIFPYKKGRSTIVVYFSQKSILPPPTITKVWFSSYNYKTGYFTSLNFSNRPFYLPRAVLKAVCYSNHIFVFSFLKKIQLNL